MCPTQRSVRAIQSLKTCLTTNCSCRKAKVRLQRFESSISHNLKTAPDVASCLDGPVSDKLPLSSDEMVSPLALEFLTETNARILE